MAGIGRNYWLAAFFIAGLVVGSAALPTAMWACLLGALLGVAGVVLFRGNRWRSGALLVAAVALSLAVSMPSPAGSRPRPWATAWCARQCRGGGRRPILSWAFAPSPTARSSPPPPMGRRRSIVRPITSMPRCARHAAGAGRRRHVSFHRRFLHIWPGRAGRPDAAGAIRQGQRLQGARCQSRRAGQRVEPSGASFRGGAARSLRLAAGQGGGDLDHPARSLPASPATARGSALRRATCWRTVSCATPARSTNTACSTPSPAPSTCCASSSPSSGHRHEAAPGAAGGAVRRVAAPPAEVLPRQVRCAADRPLCLADDTAMPFGATEFGQPWLVAIIERLSKLGIPWRRSMP